MKPFVHAHNGNISTLSELVRLYKSFNPDNFFGCYAYATQSGYRSFDLAFGEEFWQQTASRWLFGFDYGRTDPRALREIAMRENAEVRVFDGKWIVGQEGFLPRRDFHAKVGIMARTDSETTGMVFGSGNFSHNGLNRSVEAGASLLAYSQKEYDSLISPIQTTFEEFWELSTPLFDVLEAYEAGLVERKSESDQKKANINTNGRESFWIEAGYVTKNRGSGKPGNQIFFPKGFRKFFGFSGKKIVKKNSIIGSVTFITSTGVPVTNNLRLNRNGMEKISLPTPEAHGFGVYDGKVLVFEPYKKAFFMKAFEPAEFDNLYGYRLVNVERMTGGRRYGAIA